MRTREWVVVAVVALSCAGLVAGCSSKPAASGGAAGTPTGPATTSGAPGPSSPAAGARAPVRPSSRAPVRPSPSPALAMPSGCGDHALEAILAPALGTITSAQSQPGAQQAGSIACTYAGAGGTQLTLVMGPGSTTDFGNLQASALAGNAVTIQPVSLGVNAFGVAHNGVETGFDAISASNLVVSLTTTRLSLDQNSAIARQLMAKY
jgi:hypothetical protein